MRKRLLIVVVAVVGVGLIIYAVIVATSSSIRFEFDFRHGAQGWEAGFAEYAPEMEGMQLEAGIRPLSSELKIEGTGYYLQGMNRADDIFMFLKRRLGTDDGVVPGQEYRKSSLLSLLQMHLVVPLASVALPASLCSLKQVPPWWSLRYTLILLLTITS